MKLPLAYYGDPILRQKTSPVQEITDEIKQLVQNMIDTMEEHDGIGLAAPQVHRSLSIFITQAPIRGPENRWMPGTLRIFINPKIIEHSSELTLLGEGCLSIPGVYCEIYRPERIKVKATGLDGVEFMQEFVGIEAHVVMHENDHINGVLHIDRVHGKERKALENKLREIKKKYYKK